MNFFPSSPSGFSCVIIPDITNFSGIREISEDRFSPNITALAWPKQGPYPMPSALEPPGTHYSLQ